MGSRTIMASGALLILILCNIPMLADPTPAQPVSSPPAPIDLDSQFHGTIQPFLQTYCLSCHSGDKPKGDFDLSAYKTIDGVMKDSSRWLTVSERLKAEEMPPDAAKVHPTDKARAEVIAWISEMRNFESRQSAGDPGVVLARRLSNEEYNYSIRDLTGVDIQPTREFPVDPSNTAGFDNSGESLTMSPALLNKYLKAARDVASHMYLKPNGFAFAPYPMLVETDRDKFCVQQIIDLYHRQDIDYADYFQAAWRFKHRVELGKANALLADFAKDAKVSPKYLETVWSLLEGAKEEVGPTVKLQSMWQQLPAQAGNQANGLLKACQEMRDYVVQLRKKTEMRFLNITAGRVDSAKQPMLIWKDVQYATHRRMFDVDQLQIEGELKPARNDPPEPGTTNQFGPGKTVLVVNAPGDPDLFVPRDQVPQYQAAFARFCSVFPDMFYKQERGRNYFDTKQDKGRYLSAGFHNVMGYFRDDQALYELILDSKQQEQLDEMWHELDFVASANIRTYAQFHGGGLRLQDQTTVPPDQEPEQQPAPTNEEKLPSEAQIRQFENTYLAMAQGGDEVGIKAIKDFFDWTNNGIRWVEKARIDAEPSHLQALLDFAARAYRRPLSSDERDELLGYYKSAREKDGLDHESAIRDAIVSILMSPDFSYRIDLIEGEKGIHALSDYDLASRLSYFLWSSMPDDELLARAAAGDLHEPKVIAAQAKRMLADPRVRALAVEFGGNWLDFRRFESLNTVDRDRFPAFDNPLRDAMFEEPVHFLLDVFQKNRSILDCVYANDTFVNRPLAKHYGMPDTGKDPSEWVHIEDASQYDRGGLLPMAVFLTKNAPGLRTSPVKRGNWVVKNMLGERIPPPPPVVPELPRDEAKLDLPLRDMLARHRAEPSCAACHARFDSFGLAFEGYGPVGERRTSDLAGHPVDARATFPGGVDGAGLEGVRQYIRDRRQNDFVDNLSAKLVAYALGRSLISSDDVMIQEMHGKLVSNNYKFDSLIESIVTSPQFLTKRGREDLSER